MLDILNISNLKLNKSSLNGLKISQLAECETIYNENKFIIDELTTILNGLKSDGTMSEYSIEILQRYINFTTKSDFSIDIILCALLKIGVKYKIKNNNEISFLITKDAFDKHLVRFVRSEINCECRIELDNNYHLTQGQSLF